MNDDKKPVMLRLAGVIRESIVDGPGIRFTVFCQGCPHCCPGCHNEATHDFSGGYDCDIERIVTEVDKNPLLSGVTFSGGEPFCQPEAFLALARELRKRPKLNLIAYSGYTYEELTELGKENPAVSALLENLDYLVDGRFIMAQRDLTLEFRGSKNQRFIDLAATREAGRVIEKF